MVYIYDNLLLRLPTDILKYSIFIEFNLLELVGVNKEITNMIRNHLYSIYNSYNIKLNECFLMDSFLHLKCSATDAKQLYKLTRQELGTLPYTQGIRKNTKMYNVHAIIKICYSKFNSLEALKQHHNDVRKVREVRLIISREKERKKIEAKCKRIRENKNKDSDIKIVPY